MQVKKADGTKVTYIDAGSKLSRPDIEKLEKRAMACYDCHNAVGHPFPNPANTVDEAIRTGKIDRSLPEAKARAVALVNALGDITGEPKDREAKVDKLIADATAKAATPAEHKQAEQKFNKAMREILLTASFQEKGFSWKSFPNHTGHADTPGCFRCHDGKHYNDKGEAIRLQCTLCHALPEVTREKGKGTVASLVPEKAGERQPESHQRPNFMHTHSDDVGPECEKCHGTPLKHGQAGRELLRQSGVPRPHLAGDGPHGRGAQEGRGRTRQGGTRQGGTCQGGTCQGAAGQERVGIANRFGSAGDGPRRGLPPRR